MDPNQPQKETLSYTDLSRQVDLLALAPGMPADEIVTECHLCNFLQLGGILVWPSSVDTAVRQLPLTGVAVGAVVGYPYGQGTTGAKLFEGRDCLRRGARVIEFTHNLAEIRARHFQQVETELMQMADSCREHGAELRVTLEVSLLDEDHTHIALRIAKRVHASFVSTGLLASPPPERLKLITDHKTFRIEVKAPLPGTVEEVLAVREQGVTRFSSRNPRPVLEEWKKRCEAAAHS
jgi:deoxyribose-phosphate aldolase